MTNRDGTSKLLAQLLALFFGILSGVCCICGVLYTLPTYLVGDWAPTEPVILPDGSVASPELIASVPFVTILMFIVIALFILSIGVAIWFLFAREQAKHQRLARVAAVSFWVISWGFFLWGILVVVTSLSIGGTSLFNNAFESMASILTGIMCFLPAFILTPIGGTIWYFFVHRVPPTPREERIRPEVEAVSLDAYLNYIKTLGDMSEGSYTASVWATIQTRTVVILQGVVVEDKVKILRHLYDAGFVTGEQSINLRGIDLQYLEVEGVNWREIRLNGADLSFANLKQADLSGAQLTGTVLVEAQMQDCLLEKANLQGADLQNAKLHRANLVGADLENANLAGANLWQANLGQANISLSQLDSASSGDKAIL